MPSSRLHWILDDPLLLRRSFVALSKSIVSVSLGEDDKLVQLNSSFSLPDVFEASFSGTLSWIFCNCCPSGPLFLKISNSLSMVRVLSRTSQQYTKRFQIFSTANNEKVMETYNQEKRSQASCNSRLNLIDTSKVTSACNLLCYNYDHITIGF